MLLASLGVNGPNRFHHCVQYRVGLDTYVEARQRSELFLFLANVADTPQLVEIVPHPNLLTFGATQLLLPFRSLVHTRIAIREERETPLTITSPAQSLGLILASRIQLRRHGIDVTSTRRPNAFPADGPARVQEISQIAVEEQFRDLANVSRFDLDGSLTFQSGSKRQSKIDADAGYVYLLQHPNLSGWIKVGSTVDLTARLSTYQTGDPLRRYELVRFFAVDDRLAAEKWVLHRLATKSNRQNEWVEISTNQAIRQTEEAISLLQGEI